MTQEQENIEVGKLYYLADGTQVCVEAETTKGEFLVVETYEGDTTEVNCYGNDPVYNTIPFVLDGRKIVVGKDKLFSIIPIAKKLKELEVLSTSISSLRDIEKKHLEHTAKLEKHYLDTQKKIDQSISLALSEKEEAVKNLNETKEKLSNFMGSIEKVYASEKVTPEGEICITLSEYLDLQKSNFTLNMFEQVGVDNWNGYDISFERFKEENNITIDEYIAALGTKLSQKIRTFIDEKAKEEGA